MTCKSVIDQLLSLKSFVDNAASWNPDSSREQLSEQIKGIKRRLDEIIDGSDGNVGALRDSESSVQAHQSKEPFKTTDFLLGLFEKLQIPVAITRVSDDSILYYNPVWLETFGYDISGLSSLEEGLVMAYSDEEYREWVRGEWKRRVNHAIFSRGTVEPMETVVTCSDGSLKTVKWGIVSSGSHNFVYGIDLTDYKRLEAALRESEEKYRILAEEAPDWIWEMDTQGHITYSNPAIVEITGYSVEEIFGVSAYNFIHPDEIEPIGKLLEDCIKNRKGWKNFEKRWIHKDGSIRTFEAAGVPVFDSNDNVSGFRGVDRDITEKKRVTDELQRALALAQQLRIEAEAASRTKTKFLANMSHELRTPLNAILGFTELLEGQYYGEINEKQAMYLRAIHDSSSHLLLLINDILDLAKVEAGKIEISPSSFSLRLLLQNAMSMFRGTAQKRGLSMELKLASEFHVNDIWADDVRLKQIVINLLSNAVEFTPSGGKISLEAGLTEKEIRISVSDTGIGIKPEDQARIFEEFEQADNPFTRLRQGTGLGLSLTRKLVELHGGHISVESDGKDKGSVFTFEIPYVQGHPMQSNDQTESGMIYRDLFSTLPDDERPVVLVVEDNSANMKLTTSLLEIGGFKTLQALSSEEAINILKSQTPDLILMDISLPGMDGLTATQLIRNNSATSGIPVVATTAHAMKDDEIRAAEVGCEAYLVKPIDTRKFFRTISNALNQARETKLS